MEVDFQFVNVHKFRNVSKYPNITVFQNYETFNNLAHGQFMEWVEKIEFSQTVANQFMKVSKNIKQPTSVDLGINALYLIATLPEE